MNMFAAAPAAVFDCCLFHVGVAIVGSRPSNGGIESNSQCSICVMLRSEQCMIIRTYVLRGAVRRDPISPAPGVLHSS